MERSTVLIFALFYTSLAGAASADEVLFACSYELGAETDVQHTKVESVAIAIDVNTKTARIDFGKGWDRTIAIQVDGTEVKETAPANGGEDGFFHFDLKDKSGGFAGGFGRQEFFDGCVQNNSSDGVLAGEPHGGAKLSAISFYNGSDGDFGSKEGSNRGAGNRRRGRRAAPGPTGGHATTEYYGSTKSSTNLVWAVEATMNPSYKKGSNGSLGNRYGRAGAALRLALKLQPNLTAG